MSKALLTALKRLVLDEQHDNDAYIGRKVYSRGGRSCGKVSSWRFCTLEGCTGIQLRVVWKNGKWTWPCTKGMKDLKDGHLQME